MGVVEAIGVAVCILLTYFLIQDITVALVSALIFLGLVTEGEK